MHIAKKTFILYILKMLKQGSSSDRPISFTNMTKVLNSMGISCTRKTVGRNVDYLMINKVLGTDYKQYMRCTVKLKSIDRAPTAAWFVYMDGSEHSGWRNNISADGLTITERYVGNDFQYFKNAELNQYPVAFMLDPDGSGLKYARYKCRFMGVPYLMTLKVFSRKDIRRLLIRE